MSNLQSIFDTVISGLHNQGGPSFELKRKNLTYESTCLYRGPNGRKCAAGHLIPDKKYSPIFEGYSWNYAANKLDQVYSNQETEMILDLQEWHDISPETFENPTEDTSNNFESRLQQIIVRYSLVDTRPEISWLRNNKV